MISQKEINQVVSAIVNNYEPEKIILFGSQVNGTATENSDLDLFLVKKTTLPRYKRGSEVRKFLYGMGIPMDIVVYTPEEIEKSENTKFSFIYEVLNTGKLIYERSK
jgi:predicted nucleotidyltransferase